MKLVLCGHWVHLRYMHQWRQRTNFIAPDCMCSRPQLILGHKTHHPHRTQSISDSQNSKVNSNSSKRIPRALHQHVQRGHLTTRAPSSHLPWLGHLWQGSATQDQIVAYFITALYCANSLMLIGQCHLSIFSMIPASGQHCLIRAQW